MDNALDANQVDSLLPLPDKGCAMIITSRQHFRSLEIVDEKLPLLKPEDAENLLRKVAPDIGNYASKLAKLCGYLPEALRTAASALAISPNYSPEDFLNRMNDVRRRLSLTGVELSLATSSELLSDELRALWFELGVFPASFDEEAAAAVWSVSNVDAKNTLLALWRYSLVEFDTTNHRYSLHDLVRDFTLSHLNQFNSDLARSRHSAHYADLLSGANYVYLHGDTGVSLGLEIFDSERLNIESGQRWAAAQRSKSERAARLCLRYAAEGNSLIRIRLSANDQLAWLLCGEERVRHLSKPRPGRRKVFQSEVAILTDLGYAHLARGEYSEAAELFTRTNRRLEDIHVTYELSLASKGLGDVYRLTGSYAKALKIHQAVQFWLDQMDFLLPVHFSLPHDPKEIMRRRMSVLESLGEDYLALKRYPEAFDSFKQQQRLAEENGDRRAELRALGHLGITHMRIREYHLSLQCQQKSLAIAENLQDREGQANALFNAALALKALKDRTAAIDQVRKALSIYKEIESPLADKVKLTLEKWSRNRIELANTKSPSEHTLLASPSNARLPPSK